MFQLSLCWGCYLYPVRESGFLFTWSFLWGWRACEHLAGIWKIQMQLSFLVRGLLSFPQVRKLKQIPSASTGVYHPPFPCWEKPEYHNCFSLSSQWNHQGCGPLLSLSWNWATCQVPNWELGVISSHECSLTSNTSKSSVWLRKWLNSSTIGYKA